MKRVAVLMGGPGAEREVSLRSGAAIAESLQRSGYEVEAVDLQSAALPDLSGFDVVFPIIHGTFGEDGLLQGLLEDRGLPYVGCRSWEMNRSFDKEISQCLLQSAGVPVAEHHMLEADEHEPKLDPPYVLKAPRQGSSVGVEIVRVAEELPEALARVRQYSERVLVERFIPGRELTASFLGDQALPLVEIAPAEGEYDYEAKYQRQDTVYTCPAELSEAEQARVQEAAAAAWKLLGGRHLGRVDVRLSEEGSPYVLELNTLPGFTATSLLPKAAAASGLSFDQLCATLLEMAVL